MADSDLNELRSLASAAAIPLNVAVIGASGVGKSSLINAFFGVEVAKVGVGRPITTDISCYQVPDSQVAIYDTRGLEVARSDETIRQLEQLIVDRREHSPEDQQIHLAWICIAATSRRFEPVHETLAQMLRTVRVPFVIVITKSYGDEAELLAEHIRQKTWLNAPIVPVVALPKYAGEDLVVEAFGLDALAAATAKLLDPARAGAADHRRYNAELRLVADARLKTILDRRSIGEGILTYFAMGGAGIPLMVTGHKVIAANMAKQIGVCASELGLSVAGGVDSYLIDVAATTIRNSAIAKAKAGIEDKKKAAAEMMSGDFSAVKTSLAKNFKRGLTQLNLKVALQDVKNLYDGTSSPVGYQAAQYVRDITLVMLAPIVEAHLTGQQVIGKAVTYRRSLEAIVRWTGLKDVIAPELIPILREAITASDLTSL